MSYSNTTIWWIILALAIGTFVIRFSFLGMIGQRPLPAWVLRYLRYTPVAVMPGLLAPLVLFPAATGGEIEIARLTAAGVTLALGLGTRNVLLAIFGGAGTLAILTILLH